MKTLHTHQEEVEVELEVKVKWLDYKKTCRT
jgi:hypothetical protein